MKLNTTKIVETFLIIALPVTLSLMTGCNSNGDKKDKDLASTEKSQELIVTAGKQDSDKLAVSTYDVNSPELLDEASIADHISETWKMVEETRSKMKTAKDAMVKTSLGKPQLENSQAPGQIVFLFAVNKYDVTASDHETLKEHAEYLLDNPQLVLHINGFSDSRGPASVNYKLSQKRADKIRDILMDLGVKAQQLKVHAYGESFPLGPENDWDNNRRVELEYGDNPEKNLMMSKK